ncbi:MAG TPA: cache domain-containing protein [Pseudolabrys sp.]|jgi:signal transduction histidine kinase|nr:cache domain-containing protein [Pseudolabrys sp.]
MTDHAVPDRVATSTRRETRTRLFFKYVGLFVAVVCVALLINGALEVWGSYREHKTALIRIQHEQAEAAATKISQFIKEIENQVGWTTQLLWSAETIEQRRFDALRLLRQVPAITELAQVDASGKEQLRVSRLAMDVLGSGLDLSNEPKFTEAVKNKVYYGPVYFRRESEPYMTLSLAGTRRDAGVSIAEVNLKLIWDVVSRIKVGERGQAYVVDSRGRLIAHPDISLVLRNTDMTRLAQVQAAQRGTATSETEIPTATDLQGRTVLSAFAPVAPLGWTVFVELPLGEAYQPLMASIQRSALVLLAALCLAAIAGIFLARRMVVPIQALRTGAARIGRGDLSQRIEVKTGDELEALADQFNDMAGRLQESYTGLENKVEQRTQELAQSVKELRALGEVTQAVNSTVDLETVLSTIVAKAAQLSNTEAGAIYVFDEVTEEFRLRATYGLEPRAVAEIRDRHIRLGETAIGEAALQRTPIQIPDLQNDPSSTLDIIIRAGFRALLIVPLLSNDQIVGALVVRRKAPGEFSKSAVELLKTFGAQSVLAIQNARLFESVGARTRELAKSLDDLRTAQDRLVQTEKLASLGQLTAGIAHEIKNPLNFVNNFSSVSSELVSELRDALKGFNLDGKLRAEVNEIADMLQSNLEKVVQHGKRADSIVKNMLLHSRQGSGEHRLVDVNAVVEESLNLAYHGARAEKQGFNITLEKSFDPGAGEVDLFPQEITRVLLNLIMNGFYAATMRKAETNGVDYEPTLAAATRSLGDSVEIRIRDNGTGIPPEVKEKMFNPFFTTKPAGEGTGLGLSISHDIIVKQHGGSIEVDTKPGQYTEFRIILPRKAAILANPGRSA